ncbi:wHTH domain-containing protein [Streptomyces sp. NPDC054787]
MPRHQPGDLLILSRDLDGEGPWLTPEHTVSAPHLVAAAEKAALTTGEVAARLRQFGISTPASPLPQLEPGDLRIVSENLTGVGPWLDPGLPVHPAHIIQAAIKAGHTTDRVISRLTELGYRTPPHPMPPHEFDDLIFLSLTSRGRTRWLDVAQKVDPAHLVQAASTTGRTVDHIIDRLTQFGLRTHPLHLPLPEPDDLRILSRDLDAVAPWLDHDVPVHPAHILKAAHATKVSPLAITHRLKELGYRLPEFITPSHEEMPVPADELR